MLHFHLRASGRPSASRLLLPTKPLDVAELRPRSMHLHLHPRRRSFRPPCPPRRHPPHPRRLPARHPPPRPGRSPGRRPRASCAMLQAAARPPPGHPGAAGEPQGLRVRAAVAWPRWRARREAAPHACASPHEQPVQARAPQATLRHPDNGPSHRTPERCLEAAPAKCRRASRSQPPRTPPCTPWLPPQACWQSHGASASRQSCRTSSWPAKPN
mmetsp:Transcript_11084/g.29533  ORF Transcript_11084/g.29533 Transcript_11084/m.29533 type:complete len:214 (-) Transcript_11084:305-946(-)